MTPNYTESKFRIMDPDVKHLNMFCRGETATGSQQESGAVGESRLDDERCRQSTSSFDQGEKRRSEELLG